MQYYVEPSIWEENFGSYIIDSHHENALFWFPTTVENFLCSTAPMFLSSSSSWHWGCTSFCLISADNWAWQRYQGRPIPGITAPLMGNFSSRAPAWPCWMFFRAVLQLGCSALSFFQGSVFQRRLIMTGVVAKLLQRCRPVMKLQW